MEETNALLANLVQTKSIERVLAHIAAQVAQLIILNEAFEGGQKNAFPSDLVGNATKVMKSTEGLVLVAQRLLHTSADEELKQQMPAACDMLSVAGQNFVLASQRVIAENLSRESRRHLIRTAKDILEGTLKVLLVTDDAEVRKMTRSTNWVLDRLSVLTAVRSIKQLVPTFKAFTESLMLLTNLLDKRQADLTHPHQRERIITLMTTLRKSGPMLSTALQTYVKYPDNEQAKASRDYVVGGIIESLSDLKEVIQNRYVSSGDEIEDDERPGHFISTIDKVIDSLNGERRYEVTQGGGDLDVLMESAVRHSMVVAHTSTEHHRSLIVKNCQRVMHERSLISELWTNVNDNPNFSELRADYEDACARMEEEFSDLERHVNEAILQLVVITFSETTEPMERLVKAALKPSMDHETLDEDESENLLEPFITAYNVHSDRMCQIAHFLVGSSAESRRVRVIRSCIRHMEKLDPELVPATIVCRSDIHNKGALEHLRLLKHEWESTVQLLVTTIHEIIDAKAFLEVSEQEIEKYVCQCKSSLYAEMEDVADVTRTLIGLARRVSVVTQAVVDSHEDPLYRNNIMVYITQLKKVIPSLKSSTNRVMNDVGEMLLHESLHRRADVLQLTVGKIRRALDGDEQLDLMNPARCKARAADTLRLLGQALAECDVHTAESQNENGKTHINHPSQLSMEEFRTRDTIKTYIAELTDSRLAKLKGSIVTAAISANHKQTDLLSNDVLARTNHITEQARVISKHTKQHKETLAACSRELSRLTPRLLDCAHMVTSGDGSQVEPLHQVADQWAGTVTYLEGLVDGIVARWGEVSGKIVDASRHCNIPLLKAEVQNINSHRQQVVELVTMVTNWVDTENVVLMERVHLLQEYSDEFENQTTMLLTVADILAQTDNAEEKSRLDWSGREWAGLVFCMMTVIDRLAGETLQQVRGEGLGEDWEDSRQMRKAVQRFTHDTIRLKDIVTSISQRSRTSDTSKQESIQSALDDLDLLNAKMAACGDLVATRSLVQTTAELYAPHKMCVLQWQWALKAQHLWTVVDDLTLDFSLHLDKVFGSGIGGSLDGSGGSDLVKSLEDLEERVSKSKGKVIEAITPARDTVRTAAVKGSLDDLGSVTNDLVSAVRTHAETPSEKTGSEVRELRRIWACKAESLMYSLSDISAVDTSLVEEASILLKGGKRSPVGIVSSTPAPSGRNGQRIPAGEARVTPLAAATPVNRTLPSISENKPQTTQAEEQRSSSRSSMRVTFAPSAPSVRNYVSMLARFDNSDSTDEEEQTSSKFNTATTPILPIGDLSLRKLMTGPRVAHKKPEPPSAKSGFKPIHRRAQSFDEAAQTLQQEADKWEDENNAIVRVAKEMTQNLSSMAIFAKGDTDGKITNKEGLINTAKAIAKNGETLVKFAKILANYCIDKRFAKDLVFYADHVPMVATQLNILASVKAATPDDLTAEKMLLQNAENLMGAVSKMLTAAEATCVKGLRQPPPDDPLDVTEAIVLATRWQRRLTRHRWMETTNASMDELGLRRVNRQTVQPALKQIVGRE